MRHWIKTILALAAVAGMICPGPVVAQVFIQTSQTMSFGTFVVRNNNAQHTIIIDPITGNATTDSNLIQITPPQRGIYLMDGLPADTALTPIFTDTTLAPSGGGPSFTINSYTHNNPVSDALGNATIYIGATLRTSGTGVHYNSDSYSGTFDLLVDY